jgi:hypothetical protein
MIGLKHKVILALTAAACGGSVAVAWYSMSLVFAVALQL